MWSQIASIFTGGATTAISDIAKEWIQTDKESAEAKALMVKTLDPNGKMRRDLSQFASRMYGLYLIITLILLVMIYFKIGDVEAGKLVADKITDLFTPITTSWGLIVSASFGVNFANVKKGN